MSQNLLSAAVMIGALRVRSYVLAHLYFTGSSECSGQTPILRTMSVTGNRMDALQNFHTISNDHLYC